MLVVRDAQLHLFDVGALRRFEERMVAHVAKEFPERFEELGAEGALAFVRRGIAFGEENRVRAEGAVAVLIELMAAFGERFECSPDRRQALDLLAHPTLPDRSKVAAVRERLERRTGGRRIVVARPDSG